MLKADFKSANADLQKQFANYGFKESMCLNDPNQLDMIRSKHLLILWRMMWQMSAVVLTCILSETSEFVFAHDHAVFATVKYNTDELTPQSILCLMRLLASSVQ